MSRKEAEYNPVTQTFNDPAREADAVKRDAAATVRAQNQAKDRELAAEQTHDILTHERRRKGLPDPQAERGLSFPFAKREQRIAHPLDSLVPYNILSGKGVDEQHWAPPRFRPVVPPQLQDTKLRSITQQPRDYDVLSNRYKRDHDRRVAEEEDRARRVAAERFAATRDFDIIVQRHYDAGKEEAYRKKVEAMKVGARPSPGEGAGRAQGSSIGLAHRHSSRIWHSAAFRSR